MVRMSRSSALVLLVLAGITVGSSVWLVRLCWFDPGVPFLPQKDPAAWVEYPTTPRISPYRFVELTTAFRRTFFLASALQNAQLQVRAFGRFTVQIISGWLCISSRTRPRP